MAAPLTQAARDRLRAQVRCEQDLAARVLQAEARLTAEHDKRDAALAACEQAIDQRRDELADCLINYLDQAGVGLDRAAVVFGRSRNELARLVRSRRQARRRAETPAARRNVDHA